MTSYPHPVFVREDQRAVLDSVARTTGGPAAAILGAKLARAIVLTDREYPQTFVRLGSRVAYFDFLSDQALTVTLALHDKFEPDETFAAIGSALGAALIGLCPGASFTWTGGDGKARTIRILAATAP